MKNKINLALQIVPKSKEQEPYALIDKAIAVIQQSGVKYLVCPFETVMEGNYEELMQIAKDAQQACLEAGAEEMITYIKIHSKKGIDVTMEDKIGKYS